ncbi:hypothetical protein I5L32_29115, partial [Pseudomonas aeruginosa]|nr:hypothetical protein [Pseudomonas aeruginosa]
MGLFNAHAVAQQRADRIATLLQSWGHGPLATPRGAAPGAPPPPPAGGVPSGVGDDGGHPLALE